MSAARLAPSEPGGASPELCAGTLEAKTSERAKSHARMRKVLIRRYLCSPGPPRHSQRVNAPDVRRRQGAGLVAPGYAEGTGASGQAARPGAGQGDALHRQVPGEDEDCP